MPSTTQEIPQPQATLHQMDASRTAGNNEAIEQPRQIEPMMVDPSIKLRGGGEDEDICCGLCAGLACFECLKCC